MDNNMEAQAHTPDIRVIAVTEDHEFDMVFRIREQVFQKEVELEEEQEMDGFDAVAHHYLAVVDGRAAGTARWRITLGGKVRLERFAILPEYRGTGLGRMLLDTMLRHTPKGIETYVHALESAAPFFQKAGFVVTGEPFEEAGIPHIRLDWPGA